MSCLFDYMFVYMSIVDSMFMTMSMSNVFSVLSECMCLCLLLLFLLKIYYYYYFLMSDEIDV
jgi:hypothetical protein